MLERGRDVAQQFDLAGGPVAPPVVDDAQRADVLTVGAAALDDVHRPPLFTRSLTPILIADDERRYVDANPAACLFLRLPREEIRTRSIDDLTAPQLRPELDAMWSSLLRRDGSHGSARAVAWDLQMPDGVVVAVDLSFTPHVSAGRHMAVIRFPAARELDERLDAARAPTAAVLTKREREVLTLVALGHTGVQIAAQLFLSPATVQSHVTNALVKLRARNRAHGIAIALRLGELGLETLTRAGGVDLDPYPTSRRTIAAP